MEVYNEQIQYENPLLSLKIYNQQRPDATGGWHYHKELEIIVILEGKLDMYVEDDFFSLAQGDVLLIGASQLHRDRTYDGLNFLVFQFDLQDYFEQSTLPYYRLLVDSHFPLSKLNYIFRENDTARQTVADSVREIYGEWRTKQEGYEIAITLLIKRIILTLLRGDAQKLLNLRMNADMLRMKPVLDYIEANIQGKIQVEQACRMANFSYYYFVKFFKKTLGVSFLEYVNYRKIKCAEKILLTEDISVAQAGEAVGMPNMAHFYKIFKKYNLISPNEFRKKMLVWKR